MVTGRIGAKVRDIHLTFVRRGDRTAARGKGAVQRMMRRVSGNLNCAVADEILDCEQPTTCRAHREMEGIGVRPRARQRPRPEPGRQ